MNIEFMKTNIRPRQSPPMRQEEGRKPGQEPHKRSFIPRCLFSSYV